MNNKPQQMGVPIGISLLLVVFVLLALITFATLSYVSSDVDNTLSLNVANTTKTYYEADSIAQTTLKTVHDTVKDASVASVNDEEFFSELQAKLDDYDVSMRDDKIYISYLTQVNDNESIFSEIEVSENGSYKVTKWQLLYTSEWTSTTEFPVFQ